jgi:TonB family protein
VNVTRTMRAQQLRSVSFYAAMCVIAVAAVTAVSRERRVREAVNGMRACMDTFAEPFRSSIPPEPTTSALMRSFVTPAPETVSDVSGFLSCPHVEHAPGEGPVRVGGAVDPPRKVRHVSPVYPPAARAARRQGLVILEAVITRDGSVGRVRVMRSAALLDQAVIDAVRQWRYAPTLYSGRPIEVVITAPMLFELP